MRSEALVALGRIVLAKRERVMALEPYDKGLIGTTLRYACKLQAFDPSGFRDRYEEALMAHLKAKQAGMAPQPKQRWAVPRRTINLMEALRRSIAADKKAEASHRPPPRRPPQFEAEWGKRYPAIGQWRRAWEAGGAVVSAPRSRMKHYSHPRHRRRIRHLRFC
jgi:DNA end-binding protein Ku